jgi:hypothetical protein
MQTGQKPFSRFLCSGSSDPLSTLSLQSIETVVLSSSRIEPVAVYVGTTGFGKNQSAFFYVSCSQNEDDFINQSYNGVGLVAGSSVILVKDLNYQFKDGSTQIDDLPYTIVKCQ